MTHSAKSFSTPGDEDLMEFPVWNHIRQDKSLVQPEHERVQQQKMGFLMNPGFKICELVDRKLDGAVKWVFPKGPSWNRLYF